LEGKPAQDEVVRPSPGATLADQVKLEADLCCIGKDTAPVAAANHKGGGQASRETRDDNQN
jgi:hypothetical protein